MVSIGPNPEATLNQLIDRLDMEAVKGARGEQLAAISFRAEPEVLEFIELCDRRFNSMQRTMQVLIWLAGELEPTPEIHTADEVFELLDLSFGRERVNAIAVLQRVKEYCSESTAKARLLELDEAGKIRLIQKGGGSKEPQLAIGGLSVTFVHC